MNEETYKAIKIKRPGIVQLSQRQTRTALTTTRSYMSYPKPLVPPKPGAMHSDGPRHHEEDARNDKHNDEPVCSGKGSYVHDEERDMSRKQEDDIRTF